MKIEVEVADTATNLDVFCAVFLSDEAKKNAFQGGSTLSISCDSVFEDENTELTVNSTWLKSPYYCGKGESESKRYAELAKSFSQGVQAGFAESEE